MFELLLVSFLSHGTVAFRRYLGTCCISKHIMLKTLSPLLILPNEVKATKTHEVYLCAVSPVTGTFTCLCT